MIFTSSAVWCIPSRLVLPLFIGLPFVNLVTGGRLFSQCVDLPIHVDVDIQPSNHTAPVRCNHEQEFVLRRHIEKVVAKKFRLYRGRGNDFIFESGVREACSQSIFQDGDLDQDRRDLQRTTINGGWNYEFGASCRYCNSGKMTCTIRFSQQQFLIMALTFSSAASLTHCHILSFLSLNR